MIVDLTLEAEREQDGHPTLTARERRIVPARAPPYVALLYEIRCDGMTGTYLDFPGHVRATDDGTDAANCPLDRLYRVDAAVVRLDKPSGAGAVTAAELSAVGPGPVAAGALILNALGSRRFDEVEFRSVYLAPDAVEWIVRTGIRLLVSDIYESPDLDGVFGHLFTAGIATVCHPVNLHRLNRPRVRLTVLPVRFAGATQVPCRVVAETDD